MTNAENEIQVHLSTTIDMLNEIPSKCKAVKKLKKLFTSISELDEFQEYSVLISKKYLLLVVFQVMIERNITFKEAIEICLKEKFNLVYNNVNLSMKHSYLRSSTKQELGEELRELKEDNKNIYLYLPDITLDMRQVLEESMLLDMAKKLTRDFELKSISKEFEAYFEEIMKINDLEKTVYDESLEIMKSDIESKYFPFALGFIILEVIKNAIENDVEFSEAKVYLNMDMQNDFLNYIKKVCQNDVYIERYKRVLKNLYVGLKD